MINVINIYVLRYFYMMFLMIHYIDVDALHVILLLYSCIQSTFLLKQNKKMSLI